MLLKKKTKKRSLTIREEWVGNEIKVYNGKSYFKIKIVSEMIGHKLGEFVFTKKMGSTIHMSERNKKKKENIAKKK